MTPSRCRYFRHAGLVTTDPRFGFPFLPLLGVRQVNRVCVVVAAGPARVLNTIAGVLGLLMSGSRPGWVGVSGALRWGAMSGAVPPLGLVWLYGPRCFPGLLRFLGHSGALGHWLLHMKLSLRKDVAGVVPEMGSCCFPVLVGCGLVGLVPLWRPQFIRSCTGCSIWDSGSPGSGVP